MVQRPPAGTIPDTPGSYQFKDADGRVIYVGKAKSLRQRLSNYFQNPRNLPPRTAQMVATAETVEWIQVRNEVEALDARVQPHQAAPATFQRPPRRRQELPVPGGDPGRRVAPGDGHAGPTPQGRSATSVPTPTRTPSATRSTCCCAPSRSARAPTTSSRRHERLGQPCLLFHIEKCSGPCVGEIAKPDYDELVDELIDFLDGDTEPVRRASRCRDARGGGRAGVRAGRPAA